MQHSLISPTFDLVWGEGLLNEMLNYLLSAIQHFPPDSVQWSAAYQLQNAHTK